MEFSLTHDQILLQRRVDELMQKEVVPYQQEDERNRCFRPEVAKSLGEAGLLGCGVQDRYGGKNLGFLDSALIAERISRVSASYRPVLTVQNMALALVVQQFADGEIATRLIPQWIEGKGMGFMAITEPGAGSDLANMRSTAIKKNGYYEVSGEKAWVSFAPVAEWGLAYAYTDPADRYRGISCFLINLKKDENIEIGPTFNTIGMNCTPVANVSFYGTKLPEERLVGQPGDGFRICMWQLKKTRISTAAGAVGHIQACAEAMQTHANTRMQFGRKIGSFQMVQSSIAKVEAALECSRLLTYRAAWLEDENRPNQKEVSIAKYVSARSAVMAANEAVSLLGGMGFLSEHPVARYLRDSKAFEIVEGTSNIHQTIVSNIALGDTINR